MSRVITIVGPTASGKTALAIALAKHLNGEIISADSRQVYRGLDLGTGKVTTEEMGGIPHHLLDIAEPHSTYTAYDFARDARTVIDDIIARGKTPIIAGGTGFYIDTLLGRIQAAAVPKNAVLRESLAEKSPTELFSMLQERDAQRAAQMNESERQNKVRLIRALEIAAAGPIVPDEPSSFPYSVVWLGIKPDMQRLREKIGVRLDERLAAGMIDEVRHLHEHGLSYERMDELGLEYRSIAQFLQGQISEAEMRIQLEQKIWQYAKRQMTYWRRNADIHWLTEDYEKTALDTLSAIN
ncbi:MAG: tRNA (adenosine(37)-N6)-dimethylallyltransferase MiaA [Candidatus Pacebacteria bacterium]|nr:tRNA (adenosine(37)-N6)-dimethylallyltransferase MiaA [Candidatus Paceibacterota bacterium]